MSQGQISIALMEALTPMTTINQVEKPHPINL
jgi:hypothetical protein